MCGIAGIASLQHQKPINPYWTLSMASTIRHRGPDDEGFALFSDNHEPICLGGNDTPSLVWESKLPYAPKHGHISQLPDVLHSKTVVALAHRRLSILDISARGHQPMCDISQRFWISYNGEIYNYIEVRQKLEGLGHRFLSHSDTEVILIAYLQWGMECVQKFNGMWSFVIYDRAEQQLFCSRDRFGVKPFYYVLNDDFFAFASEHKALLTLPFVEKKLNEEAVFDYLVLMETEQDENGFFKNILELMPGHSLHINLVTGKIHKNKYYTLLFEPELGKYNPSLAEKYAKTTRDLLTESVRLRLRSDVPLGACLSGGIDSSSLVCLADRFNNKTSPLHVFTSTFPGMDVDESMWAKQIVDATTTEWHQIQTQAADILSDYESLIYAQDIPFFSSSTLSQSKVMQLIQQTGIKVTLDGQGADEMFSGYTRHLSVHLVELLRKGKLGAFAQYQLSLNKTSSDSTAKIWLRRMAEEMNPNAAYKWFKTSKYNYHVVQPDFWDRHRDRYFEQRKENVGQLNSYLHQEYTGSKLKYLMRTADRNSMWHSVESRVPFADDVHLAEFMFSLPSAYKIHQGKSKSLLREGMKGILPEAIRNRWDKKGFVTPELFWFRQLKNELKDLISDDLEPFVDTHQLKKNWDTIFENQLTGNTLGISRFVILAMWRKKFGV